MWWKFWDVLVVLLASWEVLDLLDRLPVNLLNEWNIVGSLPISERVLNDSDHLGVMDRVVLVP